jgi:hypothetical protein
MKIKCVTENNFDKSVLDVTCGVAVFLIELSTRVIRITDSHIIRWRSIEMYYRYRDLLYVENGAIRLAFGNGSEPIEDDKIKIIYRRETV